MFWPSQVKNNNQIYCTERNKIRFILLKCIMKGKPNIKKKILYTLMHTLFFFYFSEYLQMCDYQQGRGIQIP